MTWSRSGDRTSTSRLQPICRGQLLHINGHSSKYTFACVQNIHAWHPRGLIRLHGAGIAATTAKLFPCILIAASALTSFLPRDSCPLRCIHFFELLHKIWNIQIKLVLRPILADICFIHPVDPY